MKKFIAILGNANTIEVEASSDIEARSIVSEHLTESKTPAKIVKVIEQQVTKPDNSYVKENGGFTFKAWGIHVVAGTLKEAKSLVLEYYGKDVDKDAPPE